MQGRSVLIRADGSSTLGMGHISRCLALAQAAVKVNITVYFACRSPGPEVTTVIRAAGFQILDIEAAVRDAQREALAIAKLATEHDVQWLIIDHPEITLEHEVLIYEHSPCTIVVIDGQFRSHQCDVLINPNAFASRENCQDTVPADCRILAGYRYFMLNDHYLHKSAMPPVLHSLDSDECRILITLGASDPANCTLQICQALAVADFSNHKPVFDVVIGAANRHGDSIRHFIKSLHSEQFILHYAPENLVELLRACTLCVAAGGITLGEAAYLGRAIIGVAILENQQRTIDSLSTMGALQKSAASDSALYCKLLLDNTEQRQLLALRASALVDGLGKQRIAECLWQASEHAG